MDNVFASKTLTINVVGRNLQKIYAVTGDSRPRDLPGLAKIGGDVDPFADAFVPSAASLASAARIKPGDATGPKHVTIYPPNSIADLRRKIARAAGIPIYCQHICTLEYEPVGYEITVDTPIIINIAEAAGSSLSHKSTHWRGPTATAASSSLVPDEVLASYGRETVRVIQHDEQTLQRLTALHGYEFLLCDMRDWIDATAIAEAAADETYRELLYWGCIVKYWPILTYGAWSAYCAGNLSEYPDLESRPNYEGQNAALAAMYDLGSDITAAIKSGAVQLNVRSASINMYGTVNLNTRALFNALECTPEHPVQWLQTPGAAVLKLLRTPGGTYERLYDANRSIFRSGHVVLLRARDGTSLHMQFRQTGYTLTGTWAAPITLDTAIAELRAAAAPIIEEVNELGREVFTSQLRLTYITKWMHLSQVELQLVWSRQISSVQYAALQDILLEDARNRIIDHYDGQYYYKLGVAFDAQTDPPQNGYSYLTDLSAKEAWTTSRRGLLMEFAHQTTSVAATVHGLSRYDLPYWYSYVLYVFQRLAAVRGVADTAVGTASLKSLKARDPELFNPRVGKSIIYSRLCQKSHQPQAYTPAEYETLSGELRNRAVKYWNFTTSSPMYYACSGSKFPHMTFITGKHPQGYCLPCCKKTQQNAEMHRSCVEDHVWNSATSAESRYIMNYGRRIDVGRLGKLPDPIEKFLMYHSLSIDATAAMPNKRGRPPVGSSTRTAHFLYGVGGDVLPAVAHAFGVEPKQYAMQLHTALRDAADPRATEFHSKYVAGRESIVDFADLILDSPKYFGTQTIVISAGLRVDDLQIERLHNNTNPILCIFARTVGATTFATLREYYPIYQINNFAYFRDATIDTKLFSVAEPNNPDESAALAYRFAGILMKLSAPDVQHFTLQRLQEMVRGTEYTVVEQYVNGASQCYAARVQRGGAAQEKRGGSSDRAFMAHINPFADKHEVAGADAGTCNGAVTCIGAVTYTGAGAGTYIIPLHMQSASEQLPRGKFTRRGAVSRRELELMFTALGGQLRLGERIIYAGACIGAKCYFGDAYIGYVYHAPERVLPGHDNIILQYDPDNINAAFGVRMPLGEPCKYAANTYSQRVVIPVITYLDSARNAKLRSMFGRGSLLAELQRRDLYEDYEFVESVQRSGYYPDQQLQILREHIYQFDRAAIRDLPNTPGPALRSALDKIMRAAGVESALRKKYGAVLEADFCNPTKRDYFNRGIYADTVPEQWRFTSRPHELLRLVGG